MALAHESSTDNNDARWCEIDDLDSAELDDGLWPILTCAEYLTARLRTLCGDSFRLSLLDQRPTHDGALVREIIMFCGDTALVYGQTLAPAGTVKSQSWLTVLGERSVGDHLRGLAQVTRGPLEFARLTADHRLHARACLAAGGHQSTDTTPLWARRSLFRIGASPLLVNEVFFPGAAECGSR